MLSLNNPNLHHEALGVGVKKGLETSEVSVFLFLGERHSIAISKQKDAKHDVHTWWRLELLCLKLI